MRSWHWLDESSNTVLMAVKCIFAKVATFFLSSCFKYPKREFIQIYSYKETRPHFRCDKVTSSEDTATTNGSAVSDLPRQLETNSTASSSEWIPVNEYSRNNQQTADSSQLVCCHFGSIFLSDSETKEHVKVHLSVQRKHEHLVR